MGKEFQEQHLLVQGSGCIQLAHPASVLPQIRCRKIRVGMEVSFSDPMLSQILPGSSLPTGFFSSGLRFALKYSLSRIKGAFLYICQLSLFSFPPCLSPSLSHNYWQIADFPFVGLTDNWLNSSLEVSVRHRGRRSAEGVGFCAYWKNFFSSKQKVHVHCRLHIPCLSTRDLYVCMCGE